VLRYRGHSLVVYDPELDLVSDLVACEDAHAQERAVMQELIERIQPGELWIADRQFSTSAILQFCGVSRVAARDF
jgi:hypothetical protein